VGEVLPLPEAELEIHSSYCSEFDNVQSSFNTFYFSCANIYGNICVASRREGDSLAVFGRAGTRRVKKWMIEAKIPRSRRELVPVLRDDRGVLAVYGLGQCADSVPTTKEPCIRVEICRKGSETE
jgi:tRNA(Ile)-lysidine synthase